MRLIHGFSLFLIVSTGCGFTGCGSSSPEPATAPPPAVSERTDEPPHDDGTDGEPPWLADAWADVPQPPRGERRPRHPARPEPGPAPDYPPSQYDVPSQGDALDRVEAIEREDQGRLEQLAGHYRGDLEGLDGTLDAVIEGMRIRLQLRVSAREAAVTDSIEPSGEFHDLCRGQLCFAGRFDGTVGSGTWSAPGGRSGAWRAHRVAGAGQSTRMDDPG